MSGFDRPLEKSSNYTGSIVGKRLARDEVTREAPIVDLTPNAIVAIRNLIAGAGDSEILGIRIAVCGSGCGGLSYQMGLEAEARDGDAVIHCGDVMVFVDEQSKPLLQGTCVDFCDTPAATGFVFENPNSCGSCGIRKSCGGAC